MAFRLEDKVAVIGFDDGKANVVSHAFIDAMMEGLDKAEADASAVVIVGRQGMFSGGFDLKEIQKGPGEATALVSRGAHMLYRLFSFPQPVVAACTGHAIAAGGFTLLACDTRIGASGDFKLGLNETAIGMVLPVFGKELAADRLSKRHLTAAVIQAKMYGPDEAVDAGFLDQLVEPADVESTSIAVAAQLGELPGATYAQQKLDTREAPLARIKASLK